MGSRLWQGLGAAVIGLVVAVVAFLSLLQFQHWRQDEANVHAMVQLLNYNVARGHLEPLPEPATQAAPVAPKPPEPPKK